MYTLYVKCTAWKVDIGRWTAAGARFEGANLSNANPTYTNLAYNNTLLPRTLQQAHA